MTDQEALTYAQSIWGAGKYNARVKRVSGKKFQVGRHGGGKKSWILGEGPTWEEAFFAYWHTILDRTDAMLANGFRYPEHDQAVLQHEERKQDLAAGRLPKGRVKL